MLGLDEFDPRPTRSDATSGPPRGRSTLPTSRGHTRCRRNPSIDVLPLTDTAVHASTARTRSLIREPPTRGAMPSSCDVVTQHPGWQQLAVGY